MRYKKRCPVCGSIFTTDRTQTKYCGLVCKDIAMKKQLREWRENHPGYHAEKMRKTRERERSEQPGRQPREVSERFKELLK